METEFVTLKQIRDFKVPDVVVEIIKDPYGEETAAHRLGVAISVALHRGIDITGTDLSGADLSDYELTGYDFSYCDLTRVNFNGCILANTVFYGADLRGALMEDTFLLATADMRHALVYKETPQ